jgi:hypothetical protein
VIKVLVICLCFCTGLVASATFAATVPDQETQTIADQRLKLETLSIIKDTRVFVEETGFPQQQRLSVYLSHAEGRYFLLQKLSLLIDGVNKTAVEYKTQEQQALLRGGANRIYLGIVAEGLHELAVIFEGVDRGNNIIKKASTWFFEKKADGVVIELRVDDNAETQRPDFIMKQISGGSKQK